MNSQPHQLIAVNTANFQPEMPLMLALACISANKAVNTASTNHNITTTAPKI